MANPSIVGHQQAAFHYFQQPTNIITLIPAGIYLAGRIAPLLGGTLPTWASNVSNACITTFMVHEFAKVCSTPTAYAKDLKVAYDLFWAKKDATLVRREQNGNTPRADNSYNGPKIWTAYRLAATTFGFVSSGVALYSFLKAEGKVSPYLTLVGSGLGAAAHGITAFDHESKIRDLAKDITGEDRVFARDMVKPRLNIQLEDFNGKVRESEARAEDQDLLVKLLPTQWRGDQMVATTFFLMKAVVFTLALKEVVSSTSLVGRACQLVQTHENDIWGGLFVGAAGTTFVQQMRSGATVNELTKRNVKRT
ncbi:MAG: hypothetical protein KDK71_10225 [Chlamydiia bacterium]|nr:hypothetical protein [Chlamydiia bacterium]